jgi:hypothetical protein
MVYTAEERRLRRNAARNAKYKNNSVYRADKIARSLIPPIRVLFRRRYLVNTDPSSIELLSPSPRYVRTAMSS